MGITQKFLSMDEYWRKTSGEKIIVNDLDYFSATDDNIIRRSIMTIYQNTDIMSTVPTCDCGEVRGRYNLHRVCPSCGTSCAEIHDKTEPILWLEQLRPDIPFLNPGFWLVLRTMIDGNIDWLRWLTDSRYNPGSVQIPAIVLGIKDVIKNRSYIDFINNLETVLEYMRDHSKFKEDNKQASITALINIYHAEKEKLYSRYLPIINKRLFVMENTTKGRFVNFSSSDIMDITKLWVKAANDDKVNMITSSGYDRSGAMTGTIISKIADLSNNYFNNYLVKKEGIFRKHICGARSHFTFRCVIVSIPGRHIHDELETPWCVGVTAFRPHVMNKLVRRGYTYKEANRMLYDAVNAYHPVIHEILNELITESKYKGIPVIILRNPSLFQSSTLLMYITKWKTNTEDKTLSVSQLVADCMNADYDGDEINITLMLDNKLTEQMETIAPYYNIPSTSKPYDVGGFLSLQPPANATLSHFLEDKTENPEADTICSRLNFI